MIYPDAGGGVWLSHKRGVAQAIIHLFDSQPTVREAKAEGWDEGWVSAVVAMAEGTPANPYRSEADHEESGNEVRHD